MSVVDLFISGEGTFGDSMKSGAGKIWRKIDHPYGDTSIGYILVEAGNYIVVATNNQKFYRSDDGGITWGSDISDPFSNNLLPGCAIAIDSDTILFGTTLGEMAKLTVSTSTFGALISNDFSTNSDDIYGFAKDGATGNIVAVGASSTYVLYSDDDGATWSAPTTPPTATESYIGVVASDGVNTIMIAEHGNSGPYWISQDGGDTWSQVNASGVLDKPPYHLVYADGAWIVGVTGSTSASRSVDNGTTFTDVDVFASSTQYPTFSVIPETSVIFATSYSATQAAISYDSGVNWEAIDGIDNLLPSGAYVRSIVYAETWERYVASGYQFLGISSWNSGSGIVEQGSNSDGDYIIFSSGVQVCWGSVTHDELTIFNANIGTYGLSVYTGTKAVTFPKAFGATPYVVAGGAHDSTTLLSGSAYSPSTSGFTAYAVDNSNTTPEQSWIAIGTAA